jgi:hypothetical protein
MPGQYHPLQQVSCGEKEPRGPSARHRVAGLPGHADISTTRIYLHPAKQTGIGVRSPFGML